MCRICREYLIKSLTSLPQPGSLRVWWIPQVPMKPIYFEVQSLREAHLLLTSLARYDLFQLHHHIKPDYSNTGGLEVCIDDEGTPGWTEWENDQGDGIDEVDDDGKTVVEEESHADQSLDPT